MELEKRWPRPSDDAARVAALRDLGVLDCPPDEDLEAVVRVASYVCEAPAAAVNLIDAERQWQAATYGMERGEVARDDSMCAWSILQPGVTHTPDASRDEVFADNPFVTGRLGSVRLYASAPVVVASGHVVGTLCAFGEESRQLSAEQTARLADLATAAARILDLRGTVEDVARAAATDALTSLRNRTVFQAAVRRSLALYGEGVGWPGILFVDLDRFKPVNDRHGHHAGDMVLRSVAARLAASVRDTEVVARWGGDEFAVLVQAPSELETEDRLRVIADLIGRRLAAPITLDDGTAVEVGASIGIAVATAQDTPESLLARADAAMYAVKVSAGRLAGERS